MHASNSHDRLFLNFCRHRSHEHMTQAFHMSQHITKCRNMPFSRSRSALPIFLERVPVASIPSKANSQRCSRLLLAWCQHHSNAILRVW
uniref:Uncharacterized protein n=1 Tax=Arundo donax TaxID=35708 RepID=A0A0A9DP93_ARUDO